jgi:hypothetical protein
VRTLDEIVTAWGTRDHARALLPVDHEIIDLARSGRALVVELALAGASHRDLFHACASLGRLVAERGGSPTLAVSMIDGAREELGDALAPLDAARAAMAEGFVSARIDTANAEAAARWEYPRCAVPLEGGAVAIAAGYPDDDGEALAAWAARAASAAAREGRRRAVISGTDAARHALADALSLAGIEVRVSTPPPRR